MTILVILAGLSTFALLAARFARVDGTSLWPLGEIGHDAFWQRTMPWPRGVQEDDEIAWHVPLAVSPESPRRSGGVVPSVALARPVPPTRPQPRVASR